MEIFVKYRIARRRRSKDRATCLCDVSMSKNPNAPHFNLFFSFADEICSEYPHNLLPTPGYWIECSRQKIPNETNWDESESEREEREEREERDRGPSAGQSSILYTLLLEDGTVIAPPLPHPAPPSPTPARVLRTPSPSYPHLPFSYAAA